MSSQFHKNGHWIVLALTFACILHAPSAAMAQPVPTGPRLRDLAERANLLIGVRTFGVDATYNTIVEREFNTGTSTYYARWDNKHVGIGQYDFRAFNTGVNWLFERGMKPMQHMLFGPDQYEPQWVTKSDSASALDALMQDRIRSIMESNDNKSKVNVWNIVNESFQWSGSDGSYFPDSGSGTTLIFVKMGWEDDASGLSGDDRINDRHPVFIRKAFTYAAQYAAGKLELRDNTIERPNRKARAFYQLARHLKQSGVKIDGVGLQCHFDLDGPNKLDPEGLAGEIKKYRDLGLEVYLDEVDIGCTAKNWDEQIARQQKEEYKKLIAVALRAGANQVHFWGLRDDDENWRKGEHPLLFAADNTPKPAYYGVQEALLEFLSETGK